MKHFLKEFYFKLIQVFFYGYLFDSESRSKIIDPTKKLPCLPSSDCYFKGCIPYIFCISSDSNLLLAHYQETLAVEFKNLKILHE